MILNEHCLWYVLLKREKYTIISHRNFKREKFVVIEFSLKKIKDEMSKRENELSLT